MPPLGGIATGILGLAGILGPLLGGSNKDDQRAAKAGAKLSAEQLQVLNQLLPQLLASLGLDRQATLRQRFLSDPLLATTISDSELQDLGLDRETVLRLAEGGVPLQSQVLQGASLLLPRFMQSADPRAALQAATPQTRVGPDLNPIPTPGVPNPFPDGFFDFQPPPGTPTPPIVPGTGTNPGTSPGEGGPTPPPEGGPPREPGTVIPAAGPEDCRNKGGIPIFFPSDSDNYVQCVIPPGPPGDEVPPV